LKERSSQSLTRGRVLKKKGRVGILRAVRRKKTGASLRTQTLRSKKGGSGTKKKIWRRGQKLFKNVRHAVKAEGFCITEENRGRGQRESFKKPRSGDTLTEEESPGGRGEGAEGK